MSKFTEELRKISIYNHHNLTTKGHPVVYYISDCGRGGTGRHWVLCVIGQEFKNQAWYQHGNLWFGKENLEDALAAAQRICPDIEMVKGPWRNTWVPKVDLDAAKVKLKTLNTQSIV